MALWIKVRRPVGYALLSVAIAIGIITLHVIPEFFVWLLMGGN